MKKRRFIQNAVILCVSSILLELAGMALNAYLVRRIGASGMGLFSLIMSVYVVFMMIACAGLGTATTRIVAKKLYATGDGTGILKAPLLIGGVSGAAAMAGLWVLAPYIAGLWIKSDAASDALRALAPALPIIALSCVFRGYFVASRRVAWSAVSDIAEQLAHIVLTIYLLPRFGAQPGVAVALSMTLASVFGLALLAAAYLAKLKKRAHKAAPKAKAGEVLRITLPIALSAFLKSGLSSSSRMMVPSAFERYGMPRASALTHYGTVHAMAFPIIQLPERILLSFATLLVPEFAVLAEKNDPKGTQRALAIVMRATFAFSVCVIGVLLCFSNELMLSIYSDNSGGLYLAALAPLAIFLYLDKVVDSVLTGLHQQVQSMLYNLIESMLTVGLIFWIVPEYGMMGYLIVLYAGKALNFALSFARLTRVTRLNIQFFESLLRPVVAMLTSVVLILVLRRLLDPHWLSLAACLIAAYAAQLFVGARGLKRQRVFSHGS